MVWVKIQNFREIYYTVIDLTDFLVYNSTQVLGRYTVGLDLYQFVTIILSIVIIILFHKGASPYKQSFLVLGLKVLFFGTDGDQFL